MCIKVTNPATDDYNVEEGTMGRLHKAVPIVDKLNDKVVFDFTLSGSRLKKTAVCNSI